MPGATPNRGYPYPLAGDPVDIPGDLQRLAEAIDDDLEVVSATVRPRNAAQARSSQPVVVAPNIIQTLVPFDTIDYDNASLFQLTSDPYTIRLVAGRVYWIYAAIRFPSFIAVATDSFCRIEIISTTPSGTATISDNAYTEDAGQAIRPTIVQAGCIVIPTATFDEFRVSVRHNSAVNRTFPDAVFGAWQISG